MTQVAEISIGDRFYFVSKDAIGTIIALTDIPGKMIGIELDDSVGFHSCDGRGKEGHCVWAYPEDVLSETEYSDMKNAKAVVTEKHQEFQKITLKK